MWLVIRLARPIWASHNTTTPYSVQYSISATAASRPQLSHLLLIGSGFLLGVFHYQKLGAVFAPNYLHTSIGAASQDSRQLAHCPHSHCLRCQDLTQPLTCLAPKQIASTLQISSTILQSSSTKATLKIQQSEKSSPCGEINSTFIFIHLPRLFSYLLKLITVLSLRSVSCICIQVALPTLHWSANCLL